MTQTANCTGYAVKVFLRSYHACVLFNDGNLTCWGRGYTGALGQQMALTSPWVGRGAPDPPMGWLGVVRFANETRPVVDVAVGREHTCVLMREAGVPTATAEVRCFGSCSYGQCGRGDSSGIGNGMDTELTQESRMITNTTFFSANPVAVTAGHRSTCVLYEGGAVRCFGQLGRDRSGAVTEYGQTPAAMSALAPIDFGPGLNSVVVAMASMSADSTSASAHCFAFATGNIRCVGNNDVGQAGVGTTTPVYFAELANETLTPAAQLPLVGVGTHIACTGYPACSPEAPQNKSCVPCAPGAFFEAGSGPGGSGSCTLCKAGTTNPSAHRASCLPCAAGTFLAANGSSLDPALACSLCPTSFASGPGSKACTKCPLGTNAPGLGQPSCLACGLNRYGYADPATGGSLCADCPPNAVTLTATAASAASCQCKPNAVRQPDGSCSCAAGYSFVTAPFGPGSCSACPAGYFKDSVSNTAPCVVCPGDASAGLLPTAVPASLSPGTSLSSCTCDHIPGAIRAQAPPGGTLPAGPSGCTCPAGYTFSAERKACEPCASTHFKEGPGTGPCAPCPLRAVILPQPGGFSPGVSASQCACPPNSAVVAGSCACLPGFTLDPATRECVLCRAGTWKNTTSDQGCLACPDLAGTNATLSSPAASPAACRCVPGALELPPEDGDTSLPFRCLCGPGFEGRGGACVPCPATALAATFKPTASAGQCLPCPVHAVANSTARTGCACRAFAALTPDGSACVCLPGYAWNAGSLACEPCPVGTYKPSASDAACTPCPETATTSAAGAVNASSCVCPLGSELSAADATCLCQPGFGGQGTRASPCLPCGPLEARNSTGKGPCTPCPANARSANLGSTCTCDDLHYSVTEANGAMACAECPSGARCTGGVVEARAGFWRPDTGVALFFQCLPLSACLDGGRCAQGHMDFLCARCDSERGYRKTVSGKCVECRKPNALLIAVTVTPILLLILVYLYRSANGQKQAKLTILLNFIQFMAQTGVDASSVRWMSVLDLGLLDLAPNSCIVPGGFGTRMAMHLLLPIALLAFVGVNYLACQVYKRVRKLPSLRDSLGVPLSTKCLRLCISILLWTYFLTTKTAIRVLSCRSIAGRSVLRVDPSVRCWTGIHWTYVGWATTFLAIFSFGVPLLLYFLLVKRSSLPGFLRRVNLVFLTEIYAEGSYWWELVYLLRRGVFIIVAISLSDYSQWRGFGLLVLLNISYAAHMWRKPFADPDNSVIEGYALQALMIAFLLEMATAQSAPGGAEVTGAGLVIVILFAIVCCMILFGLGRDLWGTPRATPASGRLSLAFVSPSRAASAMDQPQDQPGQGREGFQDGALHPPFPSGIFLVPSYHHHYPGGGGGAGYAAQGDDSEDWETADSFTKPSSHPTFLTFPRLVAMPPLVDIQPAQPPPLEDVDPDLPLPD